MRLRNSFNILAALAFCGCHILNGTCPYELRSLVASGQVNQNGTQLAAAEVTLNESRGSLQSQAMNWIVTGTALKGHVTAASFKDSSNPSQVLLDLPLAPADRAEIALGVADSGSGANLGGFHDLLAAGRGMIELQTDLSAQPTVTLQLNPTSVGGWIRPNCY